MNSQTDQSQLTETAENATAQKAMQSALQNLSEIISAINAKQIFIAFSGGADSMFLLETALAFREQKAQKNQNLEIIALHINHGINPKSDAWEEFCKNYCLNAKANFKSFKLNLKNSGDFETLARNARYKIFAEQLTPNNVLLTGHHRDDQIETLLLNLFRGTGNLGLAAMPQLRKFATGYLARPLLHISKAEIYAYLKLQNKTWLEDESNKDAAILRNFVRLEVLPLLQSRYSDIQTKLQTSCQHAQSNQQLLEEIACEDFNAACLNAKAFFTKDTQKSEKSKNIKKPLGVYSFSATEQHNQNELKTLQFNAERLAELSQNRVVNLMRFIAKEYNFGSLPSGFFLQLQKMLAGENINLIEWEDKYEARKFKNILYLSDKTNFTPLPPNLDFAWNGMDKLPQIFLDYGIELNLKLEQGDYRLKSRAGGEVIFYKGKHRKVKKLLQELAIVPWQRDRQIFVYKEDNLIAVGDILLADIKNY